jgi:hypothetical protein
MDTYNARAMRSFRLNSRPAVSPALNGDRFKPRRLLAPFPTDSILDHLIITIGGAAGIYTIIALGSLFSSWLD